jgi:hypothetical protein
VYEYSEENIALIAYLASHNYYSRDLIGLFLRRVHLIDELDITLHVASL